MKEWNSFTRIEAAFNHQIPDRLPKYEGSIEIPELNPIINGQEAGMGILTFSGKNITLFRNFPVIYSLFKKILKNNQILQPFIKVLPKKISELHRKFNYDMYLTSPGIPMVFTDKIFRDFYAEEENRVIKGPGGYTVWRTSPDGAHTRNGFLRSSVDWEKYLQFDTENSANWFLVKETVKISKKLDIVPVFNIFGACAFEELCQVFGFSTFFRLLIKEKSFIKKILKELSDYAIYTAERVIENGGKYLYLTNDLGYKGRSFISPALFNELFKPMIKKFCYKIHKLDGKIMMHSCGNIMELIPDLIDAGIDALHPIEKAAGNDIVEIKEKFGNKLTLVGNVPIPLLTHGTIKDTSEYVKYLLKNISINGGHIISSSHSITSSCKLNNFLAYYKTLEDMGQYPIKIS